MSTPNPRHCKLDGLALYAPRRARTHVATVDERWRAKLERIAEAIASVEAIEAEHRVESSVRDTREPPLPVEDLPAPHPPSSPAEIFDEAAFAADECPLDDSATASDQIQDHSPRDPEARPVPPIRVTDPAALALLVRTSLVVCGVAMATVGLAGALTSPSDGHSAGIAANNVTFAQTAPAMSNDTGVGVRGPRQDRIDLSARSDAAASIGPLDEEQAALLMQRGRDLLKAGDVTDARLAFQVLADRGNADAALALAMTFDQGLVAMRDPAVAVADDARARAWYQRAMELGSSEAKRALVRMATQ
jgi:hypothetical protein